MIEMMMLGLVAYRVGKKIKYDGAAGRVTNCAEANELLSRKYRAGWKLATVEPANGRSPAFSEKPGF